MPRQRNLNLRKFLDSIPEPLIEEYFEQKIEGGDSSPLESFDYESVNKCLARISVGKSIIPLPESVVWIIL